MNVTVRMALNAGPVTGGVIGREKFAYELFGETMDCARAMLLGSEVHAVLVSQSVYDSVQDLYSFYGPFQVGEGGEMVAWALPALSLPRAGMPGRTREQWKTSPRSRTKPVPGPTPPLPRRRDWRVDRILH